MPLALVLDRGPHQLAVIHVHNDASMRHVELILRPWTEADAPALTQAIAESVEHLRPWMPWAAAEPIDLERRRAWIRETAAGPDRVYGLWLDGRIVGGGGLHRRIRHAGLEIGYWVHAAFLRRGIVFHWHAEKAGDVFPPFIWRFAVEIAAARFVGDAFNFFHRE